MSAALSVVMPVHNAAPFLAEAIQSILAQSFRDFEFVIFDDGSSDESPEIARGWARRDDRIRVVTSAVRLGLSQSSNNAVASARAPVIARMDADDVSHPDRLTCQWRVLSARPDVVLVGTLAEGVDRDGRRVRPRDRWRIVRRSPYIPFPHGSVMFRRDPFVRIGGYATGTEGVEDQDMVRRLQACGRVVTLPDALYRYRYHARNSSIELGEMPGVDWDRSSPRMRRANHSYKRGAMRLWSGERPAVLGEVLRRTARTWQPRYAAILTWATWGELHPQSLRGCLYLLAAIRDQLCGLWLRDGTAYEWRSAR